MSKRPSRGNDPPDASDPTLDRLRRHLDFLGLTYTLGHLDELLAWPSSRDSRSCFASRRSSCCTRAWA
jgi:hypothetical protein